MSLLGGHGQQLHVPSMCGIAGKLCPADGVDPLLLDRMCGVLEHRGPDSRGSFLEDGVGLAVERLAVIDLEHGEQPLYNEDRSLVVVCNGEIYNYRALRAELRRRGHRFATNSDTEVIVHLYEDLGEDCVEHLRGMFAFALWDRRRRRLFVARDRIGKKPLFYAQLGDCFWFGSEPRAILEDETVPRGLDPVAIDSYLHYQYVPPPRSAFASLRKLPPAHVLTYDRGRVTTRRYWKLSYQPRLRAMAEEDLHELLRQQLLEATELRLRSDVPIGAFLSGGVDSSSVVAAMARLTPDRLKTFSIGFDVAAFDETDYAREIAHLYDTEHHQVELDASALNVLPQLVWHYGEPFADSSAIPCFQLAELTRRHVTVALAGDGGDENFAGYERYEKVAAYEGATARRGRLRAGDRHLIPFYSHLLSWDYFEVQRRTELYTPDFLAEFRHRPFLKVIADPYMASDADSPLGRILDVDAQTYLPDDILVKVDIASMAHSLEVRSPLLDHVFMETAAAIPTDRKLSDGISKRIFKDALRDWLPDGVLDRPKQGFAVPIGEWFRKERRDLPVEVLLDPRSLERGLFRAEAIRALVDEHLSGTADNASRIWALLQLELWLRTYVDSAHVDAPVSVA